MPSGAMRCTTMPAMSAVGNLAGHAVSDAEECIPNFRGTSEIQCHSADVTLMGNLSRLDLESDRKTHAFSTAMAASSAFRVKRVGTTGMPKESSKRNAASAGKIPAGNFAGDETDAASF